MLAKKAGQGILWAALLAAAIAVPAAAQDSASASVGLTRTSTGSFSLDVDGADLRTVLRAIAEFSGRNIVLGQNAHGVVRIQLKNVAWQDALKAVLRANGLDYVEDGSVIRVDEASKLNAEKVERETANARTHELAHHHGPAVEPRRRLADGGAARLADAANRDHGQAGGRGRDRGPVTRR